VVRDRVAMPVPARRGTELRQRSFWTGR
jgi:hypothetical protein